MDQVSGVLQEAIDGVVFRNSNDPKSGRFPVVVVEQPANPFTPAHDTFAQVGASRFCRDDPIVQPLVIPLLVMMDQVLGQKMPQMSLSLIGAPLRRDAACAASHAARVVPAA